jgi:hypothetical protein
MYTENNRGPRMEPCGTPCLINGWLESVRPNGVSYFLLKFFDICL